MIVIHKRTISIMVLYCIALHVWWAFMVVIDASALNATALNALIHMVSNRWTICLALLVSSSMSLIGVLLQTKWAGVLFIPQLIMLMLSSAGVVDAVWLSHFADGVVRSRVFIAADQMHILLTAIGYSVAVITHIRAQVINGR